MILSVLAAILRPVWTQAVGGHGQGRDGQLRPPESTEISLCPPLARPQGTGGAYLHSNTSRTVRKRGESSSDPGERISLVSLNASYNHDGLDAKMVVLHPMDGMGVYLEMGVSEYRLHGCPLEVIGVGKLDSGLKICLA